MHSEISLQKIHVSSPYGPSQESTSSSSATMSASSESTKAPISIQVSLIVAYGVIGEIRWQLDVIMRTLTSSVTGLVVVVVWMNMRMRIQIQWI